MPLQFSPLPTDGVAVIEQRLKLFDQLRAPFRNRPNLQSPEKPLLKPVSANYAPTQFYDVRSSDLLKGGAGLSEAKPNGFCYIFEDGNQYPTGWAHLIKHASGNSLISSLNFGSYARLMIDGYELLANHYSLIDRSFEVRNLVCKEIDLFAIWLVSTDGGNDFVHPIQDKYKFMVCNPPFDTAEYFSILGAKLQQSTGYQIAHRRNAQGVSRLSHTPADRAP